jgi:hypothetical protein
MKSGRGLHLGPAQLCAVFGGLNNGCIPCRDWCNNGASGDGADVCLEMASRAARSGDRVGYRRSFGRGRGSLGKVLQIEDCIFRSAGWFRGTDRTAKCWSTSCRPRNGKALIGQSNRSNLRHRRSRQPPETRNSVHCAVSDADPSITSPLPASPPPGPRSNRRASVFSIPRFRHPHYEPQGAATRP